MGIYWKDLKPTDKVVETASGWETRGEFIYWHGQEAREAQEYLRRKSRSKRKTRVKAHRRKGTKGVKEHSRYKPPKPYVIFAGMVGLPWQKKEYEEVKKLHGKAYADKWAKAKFKV